jgi:CTP:molybdopterin cytidylyltransferase MocA
VLAAGAATRFGGPKQRLLLPRVLERVRRSPVSEIVVVAGAYELDAEGVVLVSCPDWERGPGASLRCGLATLPDETEAVAVCLADGPNISPRAIERVVAAWRRGVTDVAAASYAGERGHPVVIGRAAWTSIPDEGARALPATLVACDDLAPPGDVDTPRDVESLDPPLAER